LDTENQTFTPYICVFVFCYFQFFALDTENCKQRFSKNVNEQDVH